MTQQKKMTMTPAQLMLRVVGVAFASVVLFALLAVLGQGGTAEAADHPAGLGDVLGPGATGNGLAPIVAPVADVVAPIVQPLPPVVAPAVVTHAPVLQTLAPVVTPLTDLVAPIADTVVPVVAPVTDTVAPIAETVVPVVDDGASVVDAAVVAEDDDDAPYGPPERVSATALAVALAAAGAAAPSSTPDGRRWARSRRSASSVS